MSAREIRSYDYVNHSYASVRDALKVDAKSVFAAATTAAGKRAHSVASELHVNVAGIEVGASIDVAVGNITETGIRESAKVTTIPISWKAAERPGLFPLMSAELTVYPLTSTETQLDFLGRYEPPLGLLGGAVDAVVGQRIAEASVHRFIADVAAYLRKELP